MSSQGAGSRSGVFPPWVVFGWRADAGTLRRISPVLERLVGLADRVTCENEAFTCLEADASDRCIACEIKDIRRELYSAVWRNDEVKAKETKDELGTD